MKKTLVDQGNKSAVRKKQTMKVNRKQGNEPLVKGKSKFEILDHRKISEGVKLNKVYYGNCIERLLELANNIFDFALLDPPYNQRANKEDWDSLSDEEFEALMLETLTQSYRVLKPNGSILCYGSHKSINIIGYLMQKIGFDIRTTYVWHKRNGRPNNHGPSHSAEYIIWASKTKGVAHYDLDYARQINDGKNISNIILENVAPKREKLFGKFYCQKPMKLSRKLIHLHTRPDDVILVPFCGSGSECVTVLQSNRNFVAFESKEQNFQHANRWLNNVRERHANAMVDRFLITE